MNMQTIHMYSAGTRRSRGGKQKRGRKAPEAARLRRGRHDDALVAQADRSP